MLGPFSRLVSGTALLAVVVNAQVAVWGQCVRPPLGNPISIFIAKLT